MGTTFFPKITLNSSFIGHSCILARGKPGKHTSKKCVASGNENPPLSAITRTCDYTLLTASGMKSPAKRLRRNVVFLLTHYRPCQGCASLQSWAWDNLWFQIQTDNASGHYQEDVTSTNWGWHQVATLVCGREMNQYGWAGDLVPNLETRLPRQT